MLTICGRKQDKIPNDQLFDESYYWILKLIYIYILDFVTSLLKHSHDSYNG